MTAVEILDHIFNSIQEEDKLDPIAIIHSDDIIPNRVFKVLPTTLFRDNSGYHIGVLYLIDNYLDIEAILKELISNFYDNLTSNVYIYTSNFDENQKPKIVLIGVRKYTSEEFAEIESRIAVIRNIEFFKYNTYISYEIKNKKIERVYSLKIPQNIRNDEIKKRIEENRQKISNAESEIKQLQLNINVKNNEIKSLIKTLSLDERLLYEIK